MKLASLAEFGFNPNTATVKVNHPLADCEANAGARNLASVQAPEDTENVIAISTFDSHSVIGNNEFRFVLPLLR